MPEVIPSSTSWSPSRARLVPTPYAPTPLGLGGTAAFGELSGISVGSAGTVPAEATTAAFEERYYIQGQLPNGYYLNGALPVRVWIEGSDFVAEQPQLRLHAYGQDQVDAMLQLGERLVRQLERLNAAGDKISPRLARDRAWLRQLITHNA